MGIGLIVVIVVLGMLALLFLVGLAGNVRFHRQREGTLSDRIAEADSALAAARAEDRGWDRERLDAAASAAVTARFPGSAVESLDLVQVVDRPGTDEDEALMRVRHAGGEEEILLRRTGDSWTAA